MTGKRIRQQVLSAFFVILPGKTKKCMQVLFVLITFMCLSQASPVWSFARDTLPVGIRLQAPRCADRADGALVFLPKGSAVPRQIEVRGPLPCTNCTQVKIQTTDTLTFLGLLPGRYALRLRSLETDTLFECYLPAPEPVAITQTSLGGLSCPGACDGSIAVQLSGGTPPYTLDWGTGFSTQRRRSDLCAGQVDLIVQDSQGCTLPASFRLDKPPALNISVEARAPSCPGAQDGELTAKVNQSPVSYTWNTGADRALLTGLGQGSYQLTVTNALGCQDSIRFGLAAPAPIQVRLKVEDLDCRLTTGGQLQVQSVSGGNGGYMYALDSTTFRSQPLLKALPPGVYTLTVKDQLGCRATFPFVVKPAPALRVAIPEQVTLQLGERLRVVPEPLSAAWEYRWWQGTETVATSAQLDLSVQSTGVYILEVFDPVSACRVRDTLQVRVDKRRRVYFPNAFSPNGDGINDYFGVFADGAVQEIRLLEIYDRYGQLVFRRKAYSPNSIAEGWNGSSSSAQELPAGTYIYWAEIVFIDERVELFRGEVSLLR